MTGEALATCDTLDLCISWLTQVYLLFATPCDPAGHAAGTGTTACVLPASACGVGHGEPLASTINSFCAFSELASLPSERPGVSLLGGVGACATEAEQRHDS